MASDSAPSPNVVRRAARAARIRLIASRLAADAAGRRRLVELLEAERSDPPGPPEPISLRALDGATVDLRPGSADPEVAVGAFYGRYHLPRTDLGSPKLIWDLGANIGLTMRQMAAQFPSARIVGVELDADNIRLAERNLAPVADRCELIQGAIWSEPGTLAYGTADGEDGYRVGDPASATAGTATAIPVAELHERFGRPDYIKMDIEGAEAEVLARSTAWAADVPSMGVEFHSPYALEDCRRDLTALGFDRFEVATRGLLRRGSDSLYAFRTSSPSAA